MSIPAQTERITASQLRIALMHAKRSISPTLFAMLVLVGFSTTGLAQEAKQPKDPSSVQKTEFAPGVVTVIPPAPDPKETFSGPLTMETFLRAHPELAWTAPDFPNNGPHFDPSTRTIIDMAKQAIHRREIYCLEFSFKPLRHIFVDVPRADGRNQRKLIWYMVYRVRYRGGDLRPAVDKVGNTRVYKRLEAVSYESRRFFPNMYLSNVATGQKYLDSLIPSAKQKIAIREQITAPLLNSVEISRVKIPLTSDVKAPGVWGIATWQDVDPETDFANVSVFGLTNAFEQDGEGDSAPYRRKALKLNFYRPGDTTDQTADKIRFGVPAFEDSKEQSYILGKYGLAERLDYSWNFLSVK